MIEHLLPFNFTVQYLPGNKMHIADILSRLAGKDLESSDQLIPISFNVHIRMYQTIEIYNKTNIKTKHTIHKDNYTKITHTRTFAHYKTPHPKVQPYTSKPSTSAKTPPVPIGILRKSFPPKLPPPQKEVRKSLVSPNLKDSSNFTTFGFTSTRYKRNNRNIQTTR